MKDTIRTNAQTVLSAIKGFFAGNKGNFFFYAAVAVVVNILALFFYFKFDFTKDNSYSLSAASKEVVKNLDEPLVIKLFFTENLSNPYSGIKRYTQDLVEQYADAANGNFKFEYIDMTDDKNKEKAESFGIYPINVPEKSSNGIKLSLAYMGCAIIYGDLVEKVPLVDQQDVESGQAVTTGIEYHITGAIRKIRAKIDSLDSLDKPITVTLYRSAAIAQLGIKGFETLPSEIEKVFNKVNSKNFNKLTFSSVDVADERQATDFSSQFGLQLVGWKGGKGPAGNTIAAGNGVMGVVIAHGERYKAVSIPLSRNIFGGLSVASLDTYDQQLSAALDNVLAKTLVVGYVTGHGELSLKDEKSGAAVLKQLNSDMYTINEVNLNNEIPVSMKSLVINGPKAPFTEVELYHLDQFIMNGGSVLFFLSSFNEVQQQGMMGGGQSQFVPINTGLDRLLNAYGMNVNKDYVLDSSCFIPPRQSAVEVKLYFAPVVDQENLSESSTVTANLKKMIFFKNSSIDIDSSKVKEGITYDVVARSSERSWQMKGQIYLDPRMIVVPDQKIMKSYPLAVTAEGKFTSAFAAGEPEELLKQNEAAGITTATVVKKGISNARIFLTGSGELAGQGIIDADMKTPNSIFVHNAFDYVNRIDNVAPMRSKGLAMSFIADISPQAKLITRLLNMIGLPLLVVAVGYLVFRMRQARRKRIKEQFSGVEK